MVLEGSFGQADVGDDALVLVVVAVEDERTEGGGGASPGRRDPVDDRLEDGRDARPLLGRREEDLLARDREDLLELVHHDVGLAAREVDLVEDRDDDQVLLHREVNVREGLRFDPLGRVDDEDGAFAGLEAVGHLVGEVNMARRVDQVQAVDEAVLGRVLEADCARLDRDPLFALEVHRVQDLAGHLARIDGVGVLEEAVGEGRLAVIDMGDDREVAEAVLGDARLAAHAHASRRYRGALDRLARVRGWAAVISAKGTKGGRVGWRETGRPSAGSVRAGDTAAMAHTAADLYPGWPRAAARIRDAVAALDAAALALRAGPEHGSRLGSRRAHGGRAGLLAGWGLRRAVGPDRPVPGPGERVRLGGRAGATRGTGASSQTRSTQAGRWSHPALRAGMPGTWRWRPNAADAAFARFGPQSPLQPRRLPRRRDLASSWGVPAGARSTSGVADWSSRARRSAHARGRGSLIAFAVAPSRCPLPLRPV